MEQYSIGRVFSRTYEQIKSNFWTLLGFIVISYILSSIAMTIAMVPLLGSVIANSSALGGAATTDPSAALAMFTSPSFIASFLFLLVIAILVNSVMFGGAFYCLAGSSYGQKVGLGECFGVGFRRAFSLFLTQLLVSLGVLVGYIFFIIPGVILALMWAAAMPLSVLENLGPIESMRRSGLLTKGSKLGIFLTYLLLMVGVVLFELIMFAIMGLSFLGLAHGGTPSPAAIGSAIGGILLMQVVMIVFVLLFFMAIISLQVSIYREVKLVREGSDSGLADVFR